MDTVFLYPLFRSHIGMDVPGRLEYSILEGESCVVRFRTPILVLSRSEHSISAFACELRNLLSFSNLALTFSHAN